MQLGCFSINNDPKYESRTAYQNLLKKISGNFPWKQLLLMVLSDTRHKEIQIYLRM